MHHMFQVELHTLRVTQPSLGVGYELGIAGTAPTPSIIDFCTNQLFPLLFLLPNIA